jgi:HEPN domain-containing protein
LREEARLWWAQSKRDKKTAIHSHESKDYYAAVFWSHQAVEKALKAVVIEKTRELPRRTHSLLDLAEQAGLPPRYHSFLRELSPHYIVSRYPDASGAEPADLYDGRSSRSILKKSEEVLRWAGRHL